MSQAQLALPGVVLPNDSSSEWVWSEETGEEIDVSAYVHETVMRAEVVMALAPEARGGVYVDATVGGGGHSEGILEAHPEVRVIALDRDDVALAAARERLTKFGDRVVFVKTTFGDVATALGAMGVTEVDGLCADLGVSSPQLDDAARGMSFRREGPIDMRMDPSDGETALELVERLSDDELANVIFHYGDEKRSRRIARSVKRALAEKQLATTLDLRRAIVRAVGPVRVGGVDPATRTFQALRIAVNGELEQLEELLDALPRIVRGGGRVAILSFHSLEDRLVKRAFQDRETWEPLTKKPIMASDEEGGNNPRSRSAKLRAAIRCATVSDASGVRDAGSYQRRRGSTVTLRRARVFLIHWTLAVTAAALAFVVHLAMRGRTVSLGYELGKVRQEQARLREVKRVHELEAASYKTPERVEMVARSLLGMEPPGPDRIVPIRAHVGSVAKQAAEEGPHAKAEP